MRPESFRAALNRLVFVVIGGIAALARGWRAAPAGASLQVGRSLLAAIAFLCQPVAAGVCFLVAAASAWPAALSAARLGDLYHISRMVVPVPSGTTSSSLFGSGQ